jgi:para-nitrobenzyl esterase
MEDGEHVVVPILVGANDDETALEAPNLDEAGYVALVQQTFGVFATQVLAAYPVSDYPSPRDAWIALTSDVKFVCNTRRTARAAASTGGAPVYRYHFEYDDFTPPSGIEAATYHGLDVPFVLGTIDRLGAPGPTYVPTASDLTMEATMTHAWATFARDGVPSLAPTSALAWPLYDPTTDRLLRLDLDSTIAEGVRTQTCDFWDGVLP